MINQLPEKLKELRHSYGYSQKDVSILLGISPSLVSGYETGDRTPSTENLLALAYLYRCSTDYLLGKSSDKPEAVISVEGLSSEHVDALKTLVNAMKRK
jgi:transcriptional regulator with XRE-family HTH domain